MGRSTKGILGDVSGKAETVVGATWRGKSYLQSKPGVNKSNSQLAQQAKFAIVPAVMQGMKECDNVQLVTVLQFLAIEDLQVLFIFV